MTPCSLPYWLSVFLLTSSLLARGDGVGDNLPDKVRRVPPAGIVIGDAQRAELTAGVTELAAKIDALREPLKRRPALQALLPDVIIYHKAVAWALAYDEFYKSNEVAAARLLLRHGMERASELLQGAPSWPAATGLVVRAYLSRIDGSVQPYGLVIPSSFRPGSTTPFRLDFWFHGRGETLTELDFLSGRERSAGEFTPPHAFVLHSYGRFCNGNKFAGETDVFEALAHARQNYPIDDRRLVVRGFSLGGAACWHMAVHHAGLWAAAAPGAGFSETPDFLKVFQKEKLQPTWYEQKLWHMFDCTDWALNLAQCPTVAYSGENDTQKQAADMMTAAMAKEGLQLVHLIGPKMGHAYHPETKREINRRIDSIVDQGRSLVPPHVRFVTWTLKYNRMNWVVVDGLEHHWDRWFVDAELGQADNSVRVTTRNVTALTLTFDSGLCPLDQARPPKVVIDGVVVAETPRIGSDRSWVASFHKVGSHWAAGAESADPALLRKRHGLQGPIDDAFTESFLVVRPTGKPANAAVGAWVVAEMARATNQWREHFRGDARVKDDRDVTEDDMASHHLVLWGDPASNQVLSRIVNRLPIQWDAREVRVGKESFPAARHVPVLIYPNPLQPGRYVVLNSGFTFREYDYLNNARQVPKLPDFAVVNTGVAPGPRWPGEIVEAGFFDERWQLSDRGAKRR